jgi:hypothetical protein
VLTRLGLLAGLTVVCVLLATRAFRAYQRAGLGAASNVLPSRVH